MTTPCSGRACEACSRRRQASGSSPRPRAASASSASCSSRGPDVLLLDLALPGIGGMDVLRELAGLTIARQVRRVDGGDLGRGDRRSLASRRGRCAGEDRGDRTPLQVRPFGHGRSGTWVGRTAISSLLDGLAASQAAAASPSRPFGLTARELEVALLVAQGCSNREVSLKLHISGDTVKHHLSRTFDKTGVSSRLELAVFMAHHADRHP